MSKHNNGSTSEEKIHDPESQRIIIDDPAMDDFIKKKLLNEADEILKEVEENPSLSDIEAPEGMLEKIFEKAKVEEAKIEEAKKKEELYSIMSPEDKRALELGRAMLSKEKGVESDKEPPGREKHKVVRSKRYFKIRKIATVAAVFVLLFSFSMTSKGAREYVLRHVNKIVNGTLVVHLTTDETDREEEVVPLTEEEKVYEDISKKIGASNIRLTDKPEGMEFDSVSIIEESGEANVFYKYNDSVFTVNIQTGYRATTGVRSLDAIAVEQIYLMANTVQIEVWELNNAPGSTCFFAQLIYENVYYSFSGIMEKNKFSDLVSSIQFM